MHAPFDRSRKSDDDTKPRSGAGFLILPVLMAIVLIALTIFHPRASLWISQAVQAEFGGSGIADDMPVETVQQPGMALPMRTVRAN
ncbi:hypothetical protein [Bradyrhizobium sp.]|jgi:hypothetical protein|uniref:hypothetical protein n=1 Tax=Bradyrhizobium sp. TaxID=376 RepID=UPI003C289D06